MRSNDPYSLLQQEIELLKQEINELRQKSLRLPVLNADPDAAQGNVWLLEDGRLRVRNAAGTIKEYAPVGSPGGSSSGTSKPTPPAPKKTYVKTWNASWTQTYKSDDTQRSTPYLYYGYADSFNGRQKSLIGFDYANIASNLSGSTVTKVELFFHQLHSWWNNGATVRFGVHNNTSKPTNYGGVVRTNVTAVHYGKPQYKWAPIATEFGVRFRDGTGKGILIDQLTSDKGFYGYAAGLTGDGYPPAIRITYVK